jgi:hypothetical protein
MRINGEAEQTRGIILYASPALVDADAPNPSARHWSGHAIGRSKALEAVAARQASVDRSLDDVRVEEGERQGHAD